SQGDYPEDIFSVEQRRQGWVVLHIIGMIYMFVALAIVCDEFFVPALEVIAAKLEISDDVAGATFMAAGGSAPELFTSLIGVFISHSNVGIGTIVGSAVFNILFVIGMCAIFSREMLHLTWWPLFRDVTFYILDLIMLIVFFLDNVIWWWESVLLVLSYMSYVVFMKFNSQIEQTFKSQLSKHVSIVKKFCISPSCSAELNLPEIPTGAQSDNYLQAACLFLLNINEPSWLNLNEFMQKKRHALCVTETLFSRTVGSVFSESLDCDHVSADLQVRPVLQRGGSSASLHNTSLRSTIFQLMIHTLDPLGEAKYRPKILSKNKVKPLDVSVTEKQQNQSHHRRAEVLRSGSQTEPPTEETPQKTSEKAEESQTGLYGKSVDCAAAESAGETGGSQDSAGPLSLEWPDRPRKQATYLFLLPIVFPLWLTLPDVRNPASRRFFIITFIGSIFWIGIFSYLMVWWAHQVGETIGISEEIMGLTILAAGTSIPDLITSVIVARKGLGDMAVSSSVGSNIFDITVGLPVPWLIFTAIYGKPVAVSSNGLFCAIVLLFLMLLFVIISIAACRWKMSKKLGVTMFVLYFVFLILSVLLEDRVLICPISI
uniref:Sodium/potassium/calcium exchanger 1 n=1 Tax=Poecilia formosa TaxID=48698 RepID=A0A096M7K5_POEFO